MTMLFILLLCVCVKCFMSTDAASSTWFRKPEPNVNAKSHVESKLDIFKRGVSNEGRKTKSCVLVVKESEVTEIRRLILVEHVNMIDLQLFLGPNFNKPLFPHLQMTFVNGFGREIISMLDIKYIIVSWTLNVGRRRFTLRVTESRQGCTKAEKNMTDFVSGSLIKQFVGKVHLTAFEICYVKSTTITQVQVKRRCCKIAKNDLSQHECYNDGNQYRYFKFFFSPNIPVYILSSIGIFSFLTFCITLMVPRQSHEMYKTYYSLSESTMNIPCIIRHIIWNNHGRVISVIRSYIIVCFVLYIYVSHFRQQLSLTSGLQYWDYIFIYWTIFFPFSALLKVLNISKGDHRQHLDLGDTACLSKFMALHFKYDVRDLQWIRRGSTEYEDLMELISLPFNIKRWKVAIKKILKKLHVSEWQSKRSVFDSLQKAGFYLVTTLFCLLYICVVFMMIIVLIYISIVSYMYAKCKIVVHSGSETQNAKSLCRMLFKSIHEVLIFIMSCIFFRTILEFSLIPFFLGLFFNILYFIPYITVVSVCTFYFVQFWHSLENRYFALKMFIYEEYQERESNHNDDLANVNNMNQEKGGNVVPVVSKKLYHKIRERLLPYHTNLCKHGCVAGCYLLLLCFFVSIITSFQESNLTPMVKVLTAMTISVIPYICNTAFLQVSEERKKAWNENMKINVKRVVNEIIAKNPDLGRTILKIQPYSCNVHDGSVTSDSEDPEPDHISDSVPIAADDDEEPDGNIQYVTSI